VYNGLDPLRGCVGLHILQLAGSGYGAFSFQVSFQSEDCPFQGGDGIGVLFPLQELAEPVKPLLVQAVEGGLSFYRAAVVGLFISCGPSAIIRAIPFVVVYAVNGQIIPVTVR